MNILSKLTSIKNRAQAAPTAAFLFVLGLAFALIPIGIMATLLIRYSVNAPFWDQWSYVPLVAKFHEGTLTVYDLWKQHNEHRYIFPKLVTVSLAELTSYNIRFEILLNFVTASATYGLLLVMLKRLLGNYRSLLLVLAGVVAWLLFSPVQWINWIWGFQLAFFMGVFFSVLTIYMLTKSDNKTFTPLFWTAVATAFVGTYSLGNGMTIWAVGLGILLFQRVDRRLLVAWCGAAVAVMATYFYHFHRSPDSLSLLQVAKQPVAVIKYLFSYLGHNLALTPPGARLTGAVLLIILAASVYVIYKRRQTERILPWLALTAYVVCTAGLAAISRLNFGIDHSMSYSQTTISVLFIIGVTAIASYAAVLLLRQKPVAKQLTRYYVGFLLAGIVAYPMLASFIGNYTQGIHKLEDQGRHMAKVERCIHAAKSAQDECLLFAYPDKQAAWDNIQLLKDIEFNNFKK